MTMQITVEVPDRLGKQLQPFRDRLTEILERGLRELSVEKPRQFKDEEDILSLLAQKPAPEQVIALRPTPEFQERVSELLQRNKADGLSQQEDAELNRYLMLEHFVRLAKAHAYQELASQS